MDKDEATIFYETKRKAMTRMGESESLRGNGYIISISLVMHQLSNKNTCLHKKKIRYSEENALKRDKFWRTVSLQLMVNSYWGKKT